MATKRPRARPPASARSRYALNAVNFFLAELSGIGSPYLSDFLHDRGWADGAIGIAASMPGLGVLLLLPAVGFFLDRTRHARLVLVAASLAVGACYAALPTLIGWSRIAVYATLFASGLAQAFFAPLLAGLALGLVGHDHLDRTMGSNQAWNHMGDVTAALAALVVTRSGISNVFYLVSVIAVLAAISALVIRRGEIDRDRASGGTEKRVPFRALLKDRRVLVLIASAALFQTAYQSAFPFVVLRIKNLGGSDSMVAILVLVSQGSMTPVALMAGRLLQRGWHKPVFALAFVILPVFLFASALVRSTGALIALQALGSVSAGIFGVAIVAFSADLTRGTGRFHALMGASNAAFAAGAVVGPAATGLLVQRFGHETGFFALALVAVAATLLFVRKMPETCPARAHLGAA
jgi:predicted MFS family arabinose efflux permease